MENSEQGKKAITPEQWWDSQKVMTFEDFEKFVEEYARLAVEARDIDIANQDVQIHHLNELLASKDKEIALLKYSIEEYKEANEAIKKSSESAFSDYIKKRDELEKANKEIAELNRQVSNWQLLHDLVKQENSIKGRRLYELLKKRDEEQENRDDGSGGKLYGDKSKLQ